MTPARPLARWRLAFLMFCMIGAGCATVPRQTELAKRKDLDATTIELRTRVVELGREAMLEIEVAADSIDARATEPGIWRNTLLLRCSSLSGVTEAVLRADPVVAMLDLYAFRLQMSDFAASRVSRDSLGPDAVIVGRAMERLATRWEIVASSVGANFKPEGRARIEEWVNRHPIDRLPFTRYSLAGEFAKLLREEPSGLGSTVGSVSTSLDRLEHRMSLMNEYAIKQGLWLSQLAVLQAGTRPEAADLTRTLRSTRELVEGAPGLLDVQREALLAEIDRQRLETLAIVREELAILNQAMSSERAIVLAAMSGERRALMVEVDSLRQRVITDEIRMIDHFMFRFAQVLALGLVAVGVGVLLFRRNARAPARS